MSKEYYVYVTTSNVRDAKSKAAQIIGQQSGREIDYVTQTFPPADVWKEAPGELIAVRTK